MVSKYSIITLLLVLIVPAAGAAKLTIKNGTNSFFREVGIELSMESKFGVTTTSRTPNVKLQWVGLLQPQKEVQFDYDTATGVLFWKSNENMLPTDVADKIDAQWKLYAKNTDNVNRNWPEIETTIHIAPSYQDCVCTLLGGLNYAFSYKENGVQQIQKGVGVIVRPY